MSYRSDESIRPEKRARAGIGSHAAIASSEAMTALPFRDCSGSARLAEPIAQPGPLLVNPCVQAREAAIDNVPIDHRPRLGSGGLARGSRARNRNRRIV